MLHIGDFFQVFEADTQLRVESQVDFGVVELDEEEEPIRFVGRSVDRVFKTITRRKCCLQFLVGDYMHTEVDARPVKSVYEDVSDIPVELPVQEPLTLQDSIKSFCAQLIQHQFGRDSKEVDTFEEMMDFDIPDDDDWQYEAKEVIPEELEIDEPVPPGAKVKDPIEDPPADPPPVPE